MIQLSNWARHHKTAARILIAMLHVLLFCNTIYLAVLLAQLNVHLSGLVPLTAVVLAVASVLLYPKGKTEKESFKQNYFARKGCGAALLFSIVISTCFMFNKDSNVACYNSYQSLNGSFVSPLEKAKETSRHAKSVFKKSLRKQVKALLKEIRKNKTPSAGKIVLLALVTLSAFFLTALIGALSCSLACDGNGALALLVLLGGVTGIAFLLVLAFKKINEPAPAPKDNKTGAAAPPSTVLTF